MPRKPDLEALAQKLAKVQREIRRAKAEEKQQERDRDTRRKVIEGALCETHALKNPGSEFATVYLRLLKTVKPRDRHLFADIYRALLPAPEVEKLLGDDPLQTDAESISDAVEAAE